MICTYCKAENSDDCLYCPICGKPTASVAAAGPDALSQAPASQVPHVFVQIVHSDNESETPASEVPSVNGQSAPQGEFHPVDMPGPQNVQLAQANLGRLRKNWSEATELCIEVLRENPADPAAHSLLGDIYRDQTRLDEAVRWYRMALELSPNPFDQANLQKLERQITGRNLAYGNTGTGSIAQGVLDSINGANVGGTAALMGIPPQKWLKGITVSALAFLCLFVIYLITLPTKKISPVPRAISSDELVSASQGGSDGLPPARLSGPTTLPAGEQAAASSSAGRVAGTGLPPDLGVSTVPAMQSQQDANGTTGGGVAPATVKSVSPLNPGSGVGSNQVGVLAPSRGGDHNESLTGGVQPARVDAGNGAATIQLIASDASTSRDVLVRNTYRAARTVFSNDSTLQRATVIVHSETVDGATLFSADIDRASAMTASPTNDDLASLVGKLRIH